MSATTKIWANGIAPTCEDDDLNGFKDENNNLIIGSGQTLSTADNQQTNKAVAHYAGVGDFYVDSGGVNTYVLSVTGAQVAPPTYATGMRIRFVAGNSNTGASNVNVAGLGVKALVRDDTGVALVGGDISLAETRAYYDGTSFRVTTLISGTLTSPVINDPVINDPVINGEQGRGVNFLTNPEQLYTGAATHNTWTSSSVFTASTTLSTAGAVAAIINVQWRTGNTGSGGSGESNVSLRAVGSTMTQALSTMAHGSTLLPTSGGYEIWLSGQAIVKLDASSDFEYYANPTITPLSTDQFHIYLVGYFT